MKEMFLYGLAGAADQYRIVRYEPVDRETFSVSNAAGLACLMKYKNPTIVHVYLLDNRKGLGYEVTRIMKTNTIEDNVAFKDMCERNGLFII